MDEETHQGSGCEIWVQDLNDRNIFVNRTLGLRLPESALKQRQGRILKIVYDGERAVSLPPGYIRQSDGQILVDPIGAELVRQVFELHSRGLSMEKIVKKLETAAMQTEIAWGVWTIREILDNETTYTTGVLEEDSSVHLPPIL